MAGYQYHIGFITDCGNVRTQNQDSILIKKGRVGSEEFVMAAVADGMGGMESGELASRSIVAYLEGWWTKTLPCLMKERVSLEDIGDSLSYLIEDGNRHIRELAGKRGIKTGTTLSMVFLMENRFVLRHIGDSRIYLMENRRVRQLTKDHTWCQNEVDQGRMTQEESESHAMRHVLINALGGRDEVAIECLAGGLKSRAQLLLCSDGFYNYMPADSLAAFLCGKKTAQDRLNRAYEHIKETRADDNFSAVLIQTLKKGWLL